MRKIITLLLGLSLVLSPKNIKAEDNTNSLFSRGGVQVQGSNESLNIDITDLYKLTEGIEKLETKYKESLVLSLREIGTYFDENGNPTKNLVSSTSLPSLDKIVQGVLESQNTSNGAITDDLPEGKECWVNGSFIVGNGTAIKDAYERGYADGLAKNQNQEGTITYVYHTHTNNCKQVSQDTIVTYAGHGYVNRWCPNCYGVDASVPDAVVYTWAGLASGKSYAALICCSRCGYYSYQTSLYDANKSSTGIGSSLGYYTKTICNKTEQTIESATIVFK